MKVYSVVFHNGAVDAGLLGLYSTRKKAIRAVVTKILSDMSEIEDDDELEAKTEELLEIANEEFGPASEEPSSYDNEDTGVYYYLQYSEIE